MGEIPPILIPLDAVTTPLNCVRLNTRLPGMQQKCNKVAKTLQQSCKKCAPAHHKTLDQANENKNGKTSRSTKTLPKSGTVSGHSPRVSLLSLARLNSQVKTRQPIRAPRSKPWTGGAKSTNSSPEFVYSEKSGPRSISLRKES